MADESAATTATQPPAGQAGAEQVTQETKTSTTTGAFTQDQVNSLLADQKRKVQGQYQDYAELQRKAKEHDAAVEAARTDAEKAVEVARGEGRDEAFKVGNVRLIQAEIRALAAAQGFRDPHDAIAQLRDKLGDVPVTDDGVDTDALKAALTELASAKPYLINDNKPTGPSPDPGQGARPNSPDALADAEYERFYPPTTRK